MLILAEPQKVSKCKQKKKKKLQSVTNPPCRPCHATSRPCHLPYTSLSRIFVHLQHLGSAGRRQSAAAEVQVHVPMNKIIADKAWPWWLILILEVAQIVLDKVLG